MANTFKVATRASVNHAAADIIYTVPGSTTSILLGMVICNRHSAATDVDVILVSDTAGGNPNTNADVYLLKDTQIPSQSSLEIFSGQKIVLQATDQIKAQAAANDYLDITLSFMEIT